MTQEPKPGKRIVSKGAYMKASAGKVFTIVLFIGMGCYCALSTLRMFQKLLSKSDGVMLLPILAICLIMTGGLCFVIFSIIRGLVFIKQVDIGIPLTRANTADLPAPETLVRASSEPSQAQEAVLLRAAAEGQETPPEQLVRASVGMEQP